jgi:Rrf2 family transcriptional regulator, iron-sulfur cluster assembly transcription factor
MGLKLTSAADYAVRAMIHLACLPEGGVALRNEIADAQRIPPSFTAKILRSLVRAGLLRSSRGVHGGFTLARPAAEINMLEVVEAIEGPLSLADCTPPAAGCAWSMDCPACSVWFRVQDGMSDTLRRATLETLVSTPRRNGRVASHGYVEVGSFLAPA